MSVVNTNVQNTLIAVQTLMTSDLFDNAHAATVQKILNQLTASESFVNSVSSEIKSVIADGKIDMSDLPTIITIAMQTNNFLDSLESDPSLDITKETATASLKYIIYGAVYFGLLSANATSDEIAMFTVLFPSLWPMVQINPKTADKVENLTKSLFKKIKFKF